MLQLRQEIPLWSQIHLQGVSSYHRRRRIPGRRQSSYGASTQTTRRNRLPTAQISLHTLSRQLALEALRLVGCVSSQEVVISIDGGSIPNFIQTHLAQVLGLPAKPIKPLRVLVGHGHEIECHHLFADVPVIVQGHSFAIDLHVLSFSGIDLVLGV